MTTKNEQVHNMSMDFINNATQVTYADGDITFIEDVGDMAKFEHPGFVKMEMLVFIMCINGKLNFRQNSNYITLHPYELLACGPDMSYHDLMVSPDFKAKILCISPKIISSLVRFDKNILNHYFEIRNNPIIKLDENQLKLVNYYYDLLKFRFNMPKQPYFKEAMAGLVSSALYDMLGSLGKADVLLGGDNEQVTQGDMLFQRFIDLLSNSTPRPRSVVWYADQLCVTPKYLSTVVKHSSGKTALKWITDYVVADIRRYLLHSELSVKEIADELHFPNISFFGKYVKQHFGVSPTELRRNRSKFSE